MSFPRIRFLFLVCIFFPLEEFKHQESRCLLSENQSPSCTWQPGQSPPSRGSSDCQRERAGSPPSHRCACSLCCGYIPGCAGPTRRERWLKPRYFLQGSTWIAMLAMVGRESGFSPPLKVLSRSAPSLSMTMNLKFVCASLEHPEYSNVIWLRHSCRHTYPQICQFSTTLTKRHSNPISNHLSFSSPTVWLPYPQSAGRCAGPLQAFKCSGLNKKIVEVDPDQQQFGRAGTTCQQQDNSATRQREVRSHEARSSLHICALSHPELFEWICWQEENEKLLIL